MSPIDYAAFTLKAIRDHNGGGLRFGMTQLDMEILHALKRFGRGMREKEVASETRGFIRRGTILWSLERLINDKYIVKTGLNRRNVCYTITLEGRAVLDDLNARIIALAHAAMGVPIPDHTTDVIGKP